MIYRDEYADLCYSHRGVNDTPTREDTFCVDLSYLIFRTCLALIKAMMVCMDKDLLAYTAATEVEGISRKVSYVRYTFCPFIAFERSTRPIERRRTYKSPSSAILTILARNFATSSNKCYNMNRISDEIFRENKRALFLRASG